MHLIIVKILLKLKMVMERYKLGEKMDIFQKKIIIKLMNKLIMN